MTLIHDDNANPINNTNPLPVSNGYDSSNSFSVTVTSPDARNAQVIQAASSGKSIYLTDIVISTAVNKNVLLEDTSAAAVMNPIYLTANQPFEHSFNTPLQVTSGRGLNYKANISGTVTITASGFAY